MRSARAPELGPAGLTEDLWRIVASHMTLRDWARTSGTCRTLHSLPLSVVRIGDPFNEHEGTLRQGASVLPLVLCRACVEEPCEHGAKATDLLMQA